MRFRRPGPVLVDRVLAVVLAVGLYLGIWLTGDAEGHRIAASLLWPIVTVSVAFRRRYPIQVGFLAAAVGYVGQSFWPSQLTASAIAWMCDLYAVSVWAPAKWFRIFIGAYICAFLVSVPWD